MRVKRRVRPISVTWRCFPFCSTILGRDIGARKLMMNAEGTKVSGKGGASEFTPTITLKNFNVSRMLSLHKFVKLNKNIVEIIFEF